MIKKECGAEIQLFREADTKQIIQAKTQAEQCTHYAMHPWTSFHVQRRVAISGARLFLRWLIMTKLLPRRTNARTTQFRSEVEGNYEVKD